MILKALYDYYQRKLKLGEIPPLGFEDRPIQFVVVIDKDGKLFALEEQRSADGKDCRKFRVPRDICATKNIEANLLWGGADYVFGYFDESEDSSKRDSHRLNAEEKFASFLGKITNLAKEYPSNEEFAIVKKFLESPENIELVKHRKEWIECKDIDSCDFTFKILGKRELVATHQDVADFLKKTVYFSDINRKKSVCLITGEKTVPALKHFGIPIGQHRVKLVSFQKDSGYDSYCKKQGENAPISSTAEFAYTSALLDLWNSKSNRIVIGNLRILFWSDSQNESQIENSFRDFFGFTSKDNPNAGVSSISALYNSVFTGRKHIPEDNKFFILGVEANNSRMMVRFFIADTESVIGKRIAEHFSDIEIVGNSNGNKLFSLRDIIYSIGSWKEDKDIPSNVKGALFSAILSGGMYPQSLQMQCLIRARTDFKMENQNAKKSEKYKGPRQETRCRIRAAILKAYLNRKNRILNNKEREIKVSLDIENNNIGYLCGRLFAVLEHIQEIASERKPDPSSGKIQKSASEKNVNATIVDRFYGSASTAPMSVFRRLIDLSNHHLSKIERKNPMLVVYFEKLKCEIIDKIPPDGFPSHLSLDEQSRFVIGYYHQRQDIFKPKEENKKLEEKENENG